MTKDNDSDADSGSSVGKIREGHGQGVHPPEYFDLEKSMSRTDRLNKRVEELRQNPNGLSDQQLTFRSLDGYLQVAQAGATTTWLASKVGCDERDVIEWRKARGIRLRKGVARALDLFDTGQQVAQMAEGRVSLQGDEPGAWEVPEYVIRDPLNYTIFSRICAELEKRGLEASWIAKGLGVRSIDVRTASDLWTRALFHRGKKCKRCGEISLEDFCSPRCRDGRPV